MRWIVPLAAVASLLAACTSVSPRYAADEGIAASPEASRADGYFGSLSLERDVRGRTENSFADAPLTGALFRGPGDTVPPAKVAVDRKMIYRGQVAVEVARVDEAIERFVASVVARGGYLSRREDDVVTCRVPAEHFEPVIEEVKGYGRVLAESMQANDVTKQHMDLSIRLENARKSRDRLLALLEKAEKVEDILKIEEQLRRLTDEIERIEGELKYLNDQVAMSTVSAAFKSVAAETPQQRRPSRFSWINLVGVEYVSQRF